VTGRYRAAVRALVQRVSRASVRSTDPGGSPQVVGEIGSGLCALVGVTHGDGETEAVKLASRLWHLRVFPDDAGAMNRSVAECGGQVLVVSQFTLYANTDRGRRPSFVDAARPEQAEPLVERLVAELRELGASVATGRFRTHMDVSLVNDGPVTILLEV
jgi:D-tyrosyl-tRNA(Tyr) deacylase